MRQAPGEPDFLATYEDHVWDVYGYLAYRLRSAAEAEDLTQATFERALRAWDRFDPERASAKTWLLTIARNVLTDHWRKRHSSGESHQPWEHVREEDLPAEDSHAERLGLEPDLERALSRLSRRDRSVLALRFGGDLRAPEIAEVLDLSVANVQQILSRAVRKLRRELDAQSRSTSAS